MSRITNQTTRKVSGFLVKSTEAAVLIRITKIDDQLINPEQGETFSKSQWIPKSQIIKSVRNVDPDKLGDWHVKEWILEKTDLLKHISVAGSKTVPKAVETDSGPINNFGDDMRSIPQIPQSHVFGEDYIEDEDEDDIPF